jgi:predicted PurR-regulated permease PerM
MLVLVGVVSALVIVVIRKFLIPLILGAVVVGMLYPWYDWVAGRVPKWWMAAVIMLLIVILVVVAPVGVVGYLLVMNGMEIARNITQGENTSFQDVLNRISQQLGSVPVLRRVNWSNILTSQQLMDALKNIGQRILDRISGIFSSIVLIGIQFFVFFYAVYYLFLEGKRILQRMFELVPLRQEDKSTIANKFVSVTRAVIKQTFIIGAIQGAMLGGTLAILGVGGAVVLGITTLFFAAIPGLGPPVIWIPAAIYLFATGKSVNAIILIVIGAGPMGLIDNVLRPRLIGGEIEMSRFLVLIGILGGIMVFGIFGFIIGPILMSVFVTVWDIFRKLYQHEYHEAPEAEVS